MGGMFAAIGILAALHERERTGRGQLVKSALFESNMFLVAQHMTQYAVTGKPAAPMPARLSAWAVYDVFDTGDGQQVFVGVVTDTQWRAFCVEFDMPALLSDPALVSNAQRVMARERFMPILRELFLGLSRAEIVHRCEKAQLPFAPITKPEELFDDPHLACPGAMVEVTLADGRTCPVPALPIEMKGRRFGLRHDVPRVGQHSTTIAEELGYEQPRIDQLVTEGVLGPKRRDA